MYLFLPIEALGELTKWPVTLPGQIRERVAQAEVIITNKVVVDRFCNRFCSSNLNLFVLQPQVQTMWTLIMLIKRGIPVKKCCWLLYRECSTAYFHTDSRTHRQTQLF